MEFGHEEQADGESPLHTHSHSHALANAAAATAPSVALGAGGTTARAGVMRSVPAERTLAELDEAVRELLAARYAELDAAFKCMPEWNSLQLTQEALYQLLRRYVCFARRSFRRSSCASSAEAETWRCPLYCSVSIGPEITRAEVRVLWEHPGMHRDARGETVNYYEFLRAFSDVLARAFPNAKRAPPRHGDADLIMRSLRLNADTDLVREELRTKVPGDS